MLAAALLVFAATQPAEYRRRLRDVFRSLRTSHGGPAFVNNNQLADLEAEAQSRLDRACALVQSDGAYLRTCDWVMSQLRDPYAAHHRDARRAGSGLHLAVFCEPHFTWAAAAETLPQHSAQTTHS